MELVASFTRLLLGEGGSTAFVKPMAEQDPWDKKVSSEESTFSSSSIGRAPLVLFAIEINGSEREFQSEPEWQYQKMNTNMKGNCNKSD